MAGDNGAIEIRPVSVAPPGSGLVINPRPGSHEFNDMLARMGPMSGPAHDPLLDRPQPTVLPGPAPSSEPSQAVQQRAAIYCGRGDKFVLAIEQAPDWDAVYSKSMLVEALDETLDVLRALSIKITDKTGGELTTARLEAEQRANPRPSRPKTKPVTGSRKQGEVPADWYPQDLRARDGTETVAPDRADRE